MPAGWPRAAATSRRLFRGAEGGGVCAEPGCPRAPSKMEKFLQIAPHSLAIVLGPADGPAGDRARPVRSAPPAQPRQLARHHIGYEIFADFKAENMQHFWNKKVTAAVAETFFLGWIDEQVLLIQGKEEHLEALREGWTRRALRPPTGFLIRCLGEYSVPSVTPITLAGDPRTPVHSGESHPHPTLPGARVQVPRLSAQAVGGARGALGAWGWGTSWHPKPGFIPDSTLLRPPSEASPGAAPAAGQVDGCARRRPCRLGWAMATRGPPGVSYPALRRPGDVCTLRGEVETEDSGRVGLWGGRF